jgi:hypothetical protein
MRPLFGVAVPVSDTSTLPWFESAIPIGRLSPDVTVVPGHICALASTTVSIAESAIITATFTLTVHLPMRAILLDRMWGLIRLLCFQPVLCVDDANQHSSISQNDGGQLCNIEQSPARVARWG